MVIHIHVLHVEIGRCRILCRRNSWCAWQYLVTSASYYLEECFNYNFIAILIIIIYMNTQLHHIRCTDRLLHANVKIIDEPII